MALLLRRRLSKFGLRKNELSLLYSLPEENARIVKNRDDEFYIIQSREYYAAARIQGIIRGFLDRLIVKDLLAERRAIVTIQKVIRGKLGRMKWMKEYWRTKSVVKSDMALEALLERSTMIREAAKFGKGSKGFFWQEYFDPVTQNFWYFNKKNKFSIWECPVVLQKELVCSWEGYKEFGGLPSQKRCRSVFDNVISYQEHIRTAHRWYCVACEHCNYGLVFPVCGLCGNNTNEAGDDGEKIILTSVNALKSRLNQFLSQDSASSASSEKYKIKDKLVKLALDKRMEKAVESNAPYVAFPWEDIAKPPDYERLPKLVFQKPYEDHTPDITKLLPKELINFNLITPEGAGIGSSTTNAGVTLATDTSSAIVTSKRPKATGLKLTTIARPIAPGFSGTVATTTPLHNPKGSVRMPLSSSIKSAADAKEYNNTDKEDRERIMLADPLDLGVIPLDVFEEIIDEGIFGKKDSASLSQGASGNDDTSELLDNDENSIGSAAPGDDNDTVNSGVVSTSNTSTSSWKVSIDGNRLLVCPYFLKKKCSKTTCPYAHPGLRDSAVISYYKIPNKFKKVPVVDVCLDCCNGLEDYCSAGKACQSYHVYIRPSTKDIILRIYPIEQGQRTKVFPSGAKLDGYMSKRAFNGWGTLTWINGSAYMGDFKNNIRCGFGIYRSNIGDEYVGHWEDNKRHGWGIMTTANNEEYIGEWFEGKMHGVGQLKSGNGNVFVGSFINHKYNGIGMFTKSNGDKYVGYMQDGMAHGTGILLLANGEKYKGNFDRNFRHGKGIYLYCNGSRYAGNWYRGQPEGFGIWISKEGEKAIGHWAAGKKHGKCRYYFKNGDFYDGDFVKDIAEGKGNYYHLNGNFYCGEWRSSMRNGRGTYVFTNGSKYTGNWVDNNIHGKGKMDFANDTHYRGEFDKNTKHGKGIFTWANGNVYKGDFFHNQIIGKGELKYALGHRYVGDWVDNKKHGKGTFYYQAGHIYTGDWVNDIREGVGKMTYVAGSVIEESYEGSWVNDEKHGTGVYRYRADEGVVYEGDWDHGVREGKGKITYLDGSYYRGDFKKEMMWGKGVYVGADSTQYDGEWRMNVRQGVGTTIATDGSIYHGEFWQNMRHGKGKLYKPDSSVYEGTWEGNVIVGEGVYKIIVGEGPNEDGPTEVSVKVYGY